MTLRQLVERWRRGVEGGVDASAVAATFAVDKQEVDASAAAVMRGEVVGGKTEEGVAVDDVLDQRLTREHQMLRTPLIWGINPQLREFFYDKDLSTTCTASFFLIL